jgi:hypothetical protein
MELKDFRFIKIETYTPGENVQAIIDSITAEGAGTIGNYDHVYTTSEVTGHWRPLKGANPAIGLIGEDETQPEIKIEFLCKSEIVLNVVNAINKAHLYEKPVINLIPLFVINIEEE